jgi:GT2 family glycosyltransferase
LNHTIEISATIVLFKEDIETLQATVDCFLNTPFSKKLFLIDNSPTNTIKKHFQNSEIEYIFSGSNLGFGKAHNLVLNKIKNLSRVHLVLNPDVVFEPQVIPRLMKELESDSTVSMISPQVFYPNGDLQYTCRKAPTFLGLLYRKLSVFKNKVFEIEYRNQDVSKPFYPEFMYGSFMLFNTNDFLNTNGFDTRYFLYMEDADICRMQFDKGKRILYFPKVNILHVHRRESSRNLRLFYLHLISAIKYFKKWGF